ncbi:dual specificity protein phosphatase 18-like, partial [Anopheles nili]|uniref:dual specificity protein phosphatase 18-like n=3 Tax=Anopheles nili TaxID=185578 RepID=UPI00237BF7DF
IVENLYLCGGGANVDVLQKKGITLIINVTTEAELDDTELPAENTRYLRIPELNRHETNLEPYFHKVADMIHQERKAGGAALVHCVAGMSRSVTLCLAYLMKYGQLSLRDAYDRVKTVRAQVEPNESFMLQLLGFQHKLFGDGMILLYMWRNGIGAKTAAKEAKVNSRTVLKHFGEIRMQLLMEINNDSPIGGPGLTVEIDETKISTQQRLAPTAVRELSVGAPDKVSSKVFMVSFSKGTTTLEQERGITHLNYIRVW